MARRSTPRIAAVALALAGCHRATSSPPPPPPPPPLVLEQVTTIAGATGGPGDVNAVGTAARFRGPRGIARGGTALFVVDAGNAAIRRVELATGRVTLVAGGGSPSQPPADGVGASARFSRLTGAIACDGVTLFVGDGGAIRRVAVETGTVETIAGRVEEPGFADGAGDAARLLDPAGLATDGATLWIADTGNHVVRRMIVATGEVSTVAGTPGACAAADGVGSAARFCDPGGVALAGARVLVADAGNDAIRALDSGTGSVSTLAGTLGSAGVSDGAAEAARLHAPAGLSTDGETLYVAQHRTVRAVALATGEVTTLAGSAWFPGGDDGPAPDARLGEVLAVAADGGFLYVADAANDAIRRVEIATGAVATLAGAPRRQLPYGAPLLDAPSGLAQAPEEQGEILYVADTGNHVIRRLERDLTTYHWRLSTLAGTPGARGAADGTGASARFSAPEGVAADAAAVYVADTGNHTIRKLDLASGAVTTLAGRAGEAGSADGPGDAARFRSPGALTVGSGVLYVADTGNHAIRRLDLVSGDVTTLAGAAGAAGVEDGTGTAARFDGPAGIALAGNLLFVADTWNATIRRIDVATGGVTTLAGSPGQTGRVDGVGAAARFDRPTGIHAKVYSTTIVLEVADSGNDAIRWVDATTGGVGDWDGGTRGYPIPSRYRFQLAVQARGIALLRWGVVVADAGGHTIRLDDWVGTRSTIVGTELVAGHADGEGYNVPFGAAFGLACDGSAIYLTDVESASVRRASLSSGDVFWIPDDKLSAPAAVAVGASSLYVSDTSWHQIFRVPRGGGAAVPIAGMPGWPGFEDGRGDLAAFSAPHGVVLDGPFLYVADTYNSAVRRVELATGDVDTVAGGPGSPDLFLPVGIATDGATVFVSDPGRSVVRTVSLRTGAVATLAGGLDLPGGADGRGEAARFDAPMGLALRGRTLYVADAWNHAVRRVDVDTGDVTTVAGAAARAGMVDGAVADVAFDTPLALCVAGDGLAVLDSPGFARWPAPAPLGSDASVRWIH